MKTVDEIMAQAQVFASVWSVVGGRFDDGHMLNDADDAKAELRVMVEAALKEKAAHVAELERQLLEARMDALPAMREYARKNPKHHFSTDGTEQDPNGAHAWLERNDKPNTTNEPPAVGSI